MTTKEQRSNIISDPTVDTLQKGSVFCKETMNGRFHKKRGYIVVKAINKPRNEVTFVSETGLNIQETTFNIDEFLTCYSYLPDVDCKEIGYHKYIQ